MQGGENRYQIAVDIGGTFTDGVLLDEHGEAIYLAKSLTTPRDPGDGVADVVRALLAQNDSARDAVGRVVHGTTLITNTLVERSGVRAALIVTKGTLDCLDIRRELRYDIYDLGAEYPAPLIPYQDRFVLDERLSATGARWRALDQGELAAVITALGKESFDAIAVCLLHAPVDDVHEQAVGRALRAAFPDIPVSLSSDVAREIGEYERMSTVAANAYVQPVAARYLSTLEQRLDELGAAGTLDIMLSNGAFTSAQLGAQYPIRILESGPAGGVLSAVNCGFVEGITRVLAFDMGGTTAKACVAVDGKAALTHVFEFGRVKRFKRGSGLPAVAPSMDLIEIGAGGGSLATINALGLLQVGPQSAGAQPGPACYAQGGKNATVTDADLVLGYLDPTDFLGGRMQLDVELARTALADSGRPVGLDVERTAWGIHDIVNENMASAARTHIAEKGLDARQFALVATGGAGPVHAVDVARRLRISRILCPIASGVGSCLGFLAAPARSDRTWSRVEALATLDVDDVVARLAAARASITEDLAACAMAPEDIVWRLSAEIRYVGQGNTVEVVIGSEDLELASKDVIHAQFEAQYERLYRKTVPGGVPELVTWRVSGSSETTVRHYRLAGQGAQTLSNEPTGQRRLYRPDVKRYDVVPVFERYALAPGTQLMGPLVITEPESTLVVAYAAQVSVLDSGSIEVVLPADASSAASEEG
jgi:N-methylhydantoinase A